MPGSCKIHEYEGRPDLPRQAHALLGRLGLQRPVPRHLEHLPHEFPVLLVILDDQDQLVGHGRTGKVKVKVEPLPTWLWTPIVPPCSSTNRLASASPSPVPSRFWALERPDLSELLEDGRLILRARSRCRCRGPRFPPGRPSVRLLTSTLPAVRRELHRVGEEVEQDLPDLPLVGRPPRPARRRPATLKAIPWRLARSRITLRVLSMARSRLNGGEVQLHAARLDLGEVEDVVDQGEQVPAGPEDVLRRTQPASRSARRTSAPAGPPKSR